MLDGEIAAPDERGVTHLDDLTAVMRRREASRLAYFAPYTSTAAICGAARWSERKAMLAELIRSAGCSRLLYVDHVEHAGDRLLDAVRKVGGEGIVAKRRAGRYRSGPSRQWLKTKCATVGKFVITGFRDLPPGTIEADTVAEVIDGKLLPAEGAIRRRPPATPSCCLDPG